MKTNLLLAFVLLQVSVFSQKSKLNIEGEVVWNSYYDTSRLMDGQHNPNKGINPSDVTHLIVEWGYPIKHISQFSRVKKVTFAAGLSYGYFHGNQDMEFLFQLPNLDSLVFQGLFDSNISKSSIPTEIFNLKNLKHLDLSESDITEVADQFYKLTSLESLTLMNRYGTNPDLEKLPKGILKLKNLKVLNLSSNSIKDFTGIQRLKKLEQLILINCDLEKVPDDISKLKKLQFIDLSENKNLTNIQSLEKLTALKELTVYDCPKLVIPESTSKWKVNSER